MRATPFLIGAALIAAQAPAQGLGGLGNLAGGLGGGGGGGLAALVPGLGSSTVGNAAGLLGYCLKNQLLGSAGATSSAGSVLGKLTGQAGVANSPAFAAGQQGQIVGSDGQGASLANLKDQLKGKVCKVVLQRAQSMIAAR